MRRDPSVQDLHHSDIITYALTRLAGQYAREKQEILRDLRNYKAAESPGGTRLGGRLVSSSASAASTPAAPSRAPEQSRPR
jgi:hypothetical protein